MGTTAFCSAASLMPGLGMKDKEGAAYWWLER
jgi:hypothetical protein